MAEESLRIWNDSFYCWEERRNETEWTLSVCLVSVHEECVFASRPF